MHAYIYEFLVQFVIDLFSMKYDGTTRYLRRKSSSERILPLFLSSSLPLFPTTVLSSFFLPRFAAFFSIFAFYPASLSHLFLHGLPHSIYRCSLRLRFVSVCTGTRCSRTEGLLILAPFPWGDGNLRSRYTMPRAPTRKHLSTHHSIPASVPNEIHLYSTTNRARARARALPTSIVAQLPDSRRG